MTLKTFLSYCQFYTSVAVYHGKLFIDSDSAFNLLHSESSGILTRLDNEVDYFTVDGQGFILCVLLA